MKQEFNSKAYYEGQEKDIRGRWFPEHVAKVESHGPVAVLEWKKTGTSCYAVTYLIKGGTLFVSGDIGEAIYRFGTLLTWEWLAGLDLHYFAGKCCASEKGRKYTAWEPAKVASALEFHFEENPDDKAKFEDAGGEEESYATEQDWHQFLIENGHEVFGDDLSSFADDGEVLDIRCQAHLIGLQMAFQQGKDQGKAAALPHHRETTEAKV